MKNLSKAYLYLLLVWSIVMLTWGLAGFFEYFTGIVPFVKLQNAAYPDGVQFVHWLLISLAGGFFLFGYIRQWKWTPFAMIVLFSNLAVLCTIETFDFMSEQWSYGAYFTEQTMYVINALFLLKSEASKEWFGHGGN